MSRLMAKLTSFIPSMMALGFGSGIAGTTHPIPDQTTHTLPERLTEDIIKGRLVMIEDDHVVIKVTHGEGTKLHVDMTTKMDEVRVGDKVKANVNDSAHVSTLQRDECSSHHQRECAMPR
jgi:hypothetical protein